MTSENVHEHEIQCGRCGDWLILSDIAGHLASEGRMIPMVEGDECHLWVGTLTGRVCDRCGVQWTDVQYEDPGGEAGVILAVLDRLMAGPAPRRRRKP